MTKLEKIADFVDPKIYNRGWISIKNQETGLVEKFTFVTFSAKGKHAVKKVENAIVAFIRAHRYIKPEGGMTKQQKTVLRWRVKPEMVGNSCRCRVIVTPPGEVIED